MMISFGAVAGLKGASCLSSRLKPAYSSVWAPLSSVWQQQLQRVTVSCSRQPHTQAHSCPCAASGVLHCRPLGSPHGVAPRSGPAPPRRWGEGALCCALSTDGSSASHGASDQPVEKLCVLAPTELDVQLIAEALAGDSKPGDCYCLYGEVGAGKSAFSRAFIRGAADDEELPVPSPTYLLQNVYDEHAGAPIHHFDLYRLAGPDDMGRLSFAASLSQAVCLVEWAERLQSITPPCRMAVQITAVEESMEEQYLPLVEPWERTAAEADSDRDPEEMEYCQYTDRKWRKLSFVACGERMAAKLSSVAAVLLRADVIQHTGLRILPPSCNAL